MGLTCANIHVFTGGLAGPLAEADVDRLLVEAGQRLGFERVLDAANSERELAVVDGSRWVSVCDSFSAGLVSDDLTELAAQLSTSSRCPVLIAAVYDSDEFAWLLYENGKQVDGYATNEELLPLKFKKWSAKKRVQEWRRAFGKPFSLPEVENLTRPSGPFADEMLTRLCRVLGLPVEQGTLVFKDVGTGATPAHHLCFRRQIGTAMQVTQIGNPKILSLPMALQFLVGESTQLSFELSASTSALDNPVLEIAGTALDHGLVQVEDAEGIWHCGLDHVRAGGARRVRAHVAMEGKEDQRVVRASLPELSPAILQQAPKPQISLNLFIALRGSAEGRGNMRVSLLPRSGGPERLSLRPEFFPQVLMPKWVPLGCPLNWGVRKLNNPTTLSGVAIVEDDAEKSFHGIHTLLGSWLSSVEINAPCHLKIVYEGQMKPDTGYVPKKKIELALAELARDKKWTKLFEKPDALQSLFVEIVEDATGQPRAGTAVQRALTDRPARETIHISFWFKSAADSETTETLHGARKQLTRLMDSAFTTLIGLQGWVAQWDWIPRFSTADEYEYTPYEDACMYTLVRRVDETSPQGHVDIHVSHTRTTESGLDAVGGFMSRRYCGRHLRGLSEHVWLGAPLIALVSKDRLAAIARLTNIGSSLRIDLLPGQRLNRLEEVLKPILPPSKGQAGN